MDKKSHNWKCAKCNSRVTLVYIIGEVIVGWGSENAWPNPSQFKCPVCGITIEQSQKIKSQGSPVGTTVCQ